MRKPPKSTPIVVHLRKRKKVSPEGSQKKRHEPAHRGGCQEGPPAVRKEVDPDSLRNAWSIAFGFRLRIDDRMGFLLDGYPIGLDDLMLETNRIRRAKNMPPVGKKPGWLP
ncbi:hypothetical protein [Fimbriiglobus ruber]|uniref:Uncharacterized protein n=1 Tax=Fimbriiglobus ruber TaxID=1908690 RepID=A0A225D637_9BACT|nr:hypothetical protein [Fimbriiglobus ruber]OWK35420.1 hypothetical protein FRUB_07983 [Fimbriiglobus ruber]OWK36922.1 hypothetical protein FRUB_07974 [Fimbriiglobus ruber]OWK42444.1 hypothetical protein FRUB_04522 [Fimbriiglobus ruber]